MRFWSIYVILITIYFNAVCCVHLPPCTPYNLDMKDINEKGTWELLKDGTFKLTFKHCSVHEFTVSDAKKCLRNEFLLFMGDSLSRYFYLSLASFFANGHWAVDKLTHNTISTNEVSVMAEADYKSWSEFYRISNAYLNNKKTNSYEICDCFRDDASTWNGEDPCPPTGTCSQQESCLENRMFRTYLKHNEDEDGEDMVRLGYIQYYSGMPMRGRTSLLGSLPSKESAFKKYISDIGELMCPLSVLEVARVGELDQDHNRIPENPEKNSSLNEVFNAIVHRNRINITNALLPIRGSCGKELVWHRDDENSPTKLSLPQFHTDHNGEFEEIVLKSLNITHLIVNIGYHAEFHMDEEHPDPTHWLRTRVKHAKLNYRVNKHSGHNGHTGHSPHKKHDHKVEYKQRRRAMSNSVDSDNSNSNTNSKSNSIEYGLGKGSSSTKHNNHHMSQSHHGHHSSLILPQVTYRGCTPYAPFTNNDENAKKLYNEYRIKQTEQAGRMETGNWSDSLLIDSDTITDNVVDTMGLMPVWDLMVQLWDIHKFIADNNITKLSIKEYNTFKNNINAQVTTNQLKTLINLKFELSHEVLLLLANTDTNANDIDGGSTSTSIPMYRIYVDAAHPQPWVYDQLNNAFLNSVCHI